MRNISFQLTTEQIRNRTKTVTRRLGWLWLVEAVAKGETPLLQPIVKGQGLKPGEKIEPIGRPICVLDARREHLNLLIGGSYTPRMAKRECEREGFPYYSPRLFVEMFCQHMKCKPHQVITRIEFMYVD